MGLFKAKEEREIAQKRKISKKANDALFLGKCVQNIGPIMIGEICSLSIDVDNDKLQIKSGKKTAKIPLNRILGFSLNDEVTLSHGKTSIGRAVIGGFFFGDSGAIIGANSKKGNTETRWIGTLLYTDKQGDTVETNFIAQGFTGEYRKKQVPTLHYNFETALRNLLNQSLETDVEL